MNNSQYNILDAQYKDRRISLILLEKAQQLYQQERYIASMACIAKALKETTKAPNSKTASRRDAVILYAWNMHQLRRNAACRKWLELALLEKEIPATDMEAQLILFWID